MPLEREREGEAMGTELLSSKDEVIQGSGVAADLP
jgi:hypothetical protein